MSATKAKAEEELETSKTDEAATSPAPETEPAEAETSGDEASEGDAAEEGTVEETQAVYPPLTSPAAVGAPADIATFSTPKAGE